MGPGLGLVSRFGLEDRGAFWPFLNGDVFPGSRDANSHALGAFCTRLGYPVRGSLLLREKIAGFLQERESSADRAALDLFQVVLPQLVFSLQNLELFLWLEKRLLVERGVLTEQNACTRRPRWTPDEDAIAHGLRLNARLSKACANL